MKNAVVTGGTRGIGYAICKKLSENGYLVTIMGRADAKEVSTSIKELGAQYVQGDLGNAADREKLLEAVGNVDLLVNNAGVGPKVRADMLEMTEEDYDFVMNINLKGTFFLTQHIANAMIAQNNGGCIINISSISAYTSSTNRAQYCISKAGVSMCTDLFADRLAEHGIGVYEVRPGIIKTDMTNQVTEKYDNLIFNENILPIKRWGKPDDVADAVYAIANGAFSYSTGEVINVDGGFHLRRL